MRKFAQKSAAYYPRARHRAQRRKSFWNVLLILLGFAASFAVWYALFRLVWLIHIALYPDHYLADFWQEGISFRSFIPSFFMVFSIAPGAVTVGLILSNPFFWLISPARRTFDAETGDYPGMNFRESMRKLFIAGCWILPIGLITACVAALLLKSLR